MGLPQNWMVYSGNSKKIDDDWGYLHFRKPPCRLENPPSDFDNLIHWASVSAGARLFHWWAKTGHHLGWALRRKSEKIWGTATGTVGFDGSTAQRFSRCEIWKFGTRSASCISLARKKWELLLMGVPKLGDNLCRLRLTGKHRFSVIFFSISSHSAHPWQP